MLLSTLAAYTRDEIQEALQNVGFKDIDIRNSKDGNLLVGFATK